jgi:hypothetical protein
MAGAVLSSPAAISILEILMEQLSLDFEPAPAPVKKKYRDGRWVGVRCIDCGAEWLKRKNGLAQWDGRCRACADRQRRVPLRECPQCHEMFRPEKKKQRHCSKRCGGKSRTYSRKPAELRFWSHVQKGTGDECWIWLGSKTPSGYGSFGLRKGRLTPAHRFAYELLRGAIPEGLELDHLCRNPFCCNPDHLESVSHRVNVLRGESPAAQNARRTHCPHGHPYTPENTYIRPNTGDRQCRICLRERARQDRERLKS